ncbi:MAG: 2Fe-2S iron-sulfur cluster binding domain-containing protein [Kofleriaceae bacterium]|nr:2Fe-2S iron-sulfur cluster binding domain-containing protein [Kofleriaceae bacterium]
MAPQPTLAASGAWAGWREFRVERREYEDSAHTLCSFYLAPVDGAALLPFVPGQFLTFAVPISAAQTLTRCYSLSNAPSASNYQITVKRVLAPSGQPALPPGVCSNQLHDQLHIGDVIKVKAPAGRFVVSQEPNVPIVLIAGGIGITPLLSMLRGGVLTANNRSVHLFYGARCGAEHGFRTELATLAREHGNFHLHVVYNQPDQDDELGRDFDHLGFIDVDLLRRTLPAGRHTFYVCGPPPMMASLVPGLRAWGVPADDIFQEAFGPASVRIDHVATSAPLDQLQIVFKTSGRTLTWDGNDSNLLDLAERHNIAVASGCRTGSCGSCEVRLLAGTVRYAAKPDHDIAPNHCLLCVGSPAGPLELEA